MTEVAMREAIEWERTQEFLVEADARLRAFADREVKYYVENELTCVKVHAVMLMLRTERAGILTMALSKPAMAHPAWSADRLAHTYVEQWVERLKQPRKYEELDVRLGGPPSWAQVV